MKYEVKKSGWYHRNRPVVLGEVLELDPDGARWLLGQGKIAPVIAEDGSQKRRGRGRVAAEETNAPGAPATTGGDEK
jgi:hypothetical protein